LTSEGTEDPASLLLPSDPGGWPAQHALCHANADSACPQEIISGGDIEELDLFPEYLRGAIRRNDTGSHQTAAVSMNFPSHVIADVDCIMTMEVYPNKVERLAVLIFDAHLETNGEVRELIVPGGLKVIAIQLQGSPPGSVTNVFGRITAAALESAPYRRREISEAGAQVATRCVTMSDFTDVHKGAIITLTLGRRAASQLYEKLFKSKVHNRYFCFCIHRISLQSLPIFLYRATREFKRPVVRENSLHAVSKFPSAPPIGPFPLQQSDSRPGPGNPLSCPYYPLPGMTSLSDLLRFLGREVLEALSRQLDELKSPALEPRTLITVSGALIISRHSLAGFSAWNSKAS
jgi:hypothetical protein